MTNKTKNKSKKNILISDEDFTDRDGLGEPSGTRTMRLSNESLPRGELSIVPFHSVIAESHCEDTGIVTLNTNNI